MVAITKRTHFYSGRVKISKLSISMTLTGIPLEKVDLASSSEADLAVLV